MENIIKNRKGMLVIVCPNYDEAFYYSGERKIEEDSYLINQDNLTPF